VGTLIALPVDKRKSSKAEEKQKEKRQAYKPFMETRRIKNTVMHACTFYKNATLFFFFHSLLCVVAANCVWYDMQMLDAM